ncbi:hypothetical protein DIDNDMLP_00084 [Klebsiella phage KP13-7]|nr:hypothetical protein DIDNDMLP_00084 [Klebsiella phage KP13-7]
MNDTQFESFDIESILKPTDNCTVLMNMYWIVKDEKVFRSLRTKVWQCNKFESVVKRVIESYPGCEVRFLEYAYVKKD